MLKAVLTERTLNKYVKECSYEGSSGTNFSKYFLPRNLFGFNFNNSVIGKTFPWLFYIKS